ncbi:MAG: polysaccharide biosynthesis tyrosine autokinase [Planctomycetaceae bacterium]
MDTRDSHEPKLPARLSPSRPLPPQVKGPEPEGRAGKTLSYRIMLRGITRYWWQILAIWVTGSMALVALVYSRVDPVYEAVALLQAEPGVQDLFGIQIHSSEARSAYLQTQVVMITSANVLTAVALDPDVQRTEIIRKAQRDPKAELRKLLQVQVIPGTNLIQVSMGGPSPTEASTIVNKVVDIYLKTQAEWSENVTRTQIEKLESYEKELRGLLEEQDKEWLRLVDQNDVDPQVSPPADSTVDGADPTVDGADSTSVGAAKSARKKVVPLKVVPLEQFKSVRQQLIQITLDLIQAEALLTRRQQDSKGGPDPRVLLVRQLEDRLSVDPDLMRVSEEVRKAQDSLAAARRVSKSRLDPAVVASGRRVVEATTRYEGLRAQKERSLREVLMEQANDPGRGLREAQERVATLRAIKDGFEKELNRIQVSQKQDARASVQIQLVREAREGLREMRSAVNKRLRQLMFEQKEEARIRLANAASPPGVPLKDSRLKMMAVIPVGLLGALMGLALVAELRSGRVSHPDELAPMLPVEVFSVPPLPMQRAARKVDGQAGLIEVFAQRLDHLRVALGIDTVAGQGGRCVLITSATGAEGKTTLSAQLAGRCASAGVRTLLIDADLRRATLSRMLDVPQGHGLVNVLGGEVEVEEAVVNIDGAGSLYLLPAGTSGQDPGRVLRGPELGQMLEHLRQDFELILIDTPPVLPVPDALTVGQWVDGALIAARNDTSRLSLVERASRSLASARIPVFGVVVNGVPTEKSYAEYAYRYPQPVVATSDVSPGDPRPGAGSSR